MPHVTLREVGLHSAAGIPLVAEGKTLGAIAMVYGDSLRQYTADDLPMLEELGRHHTVVAPDLLGHGRSEKPRADYSVAAYANGMRDLLSVLEIDRATVIGHSLGGGVAAQFAYQFPERCERLVLVDSGGIGRYF